MDQGAVALQEAVRRRAGMGASSAGMGAPVANSPMPSNPLAQQGMTPQAPAGQPDVQAGVGNHVSAPTAENPLVGAQQMLSKSQPDGASMIIKSFADYLKRSPIAGEQPKLTMP